VRGATLQDQIGQHFVVDFRGASAGPAVERLFREGRVGGVVLFAENLRDPAQVASLTSDLEALAEDCGLPPPLICVDQEGGVVSRLVEGFTPFPGAMALGAAGRPEWAEAVAHAQAEELAAVGIRVNLAPVLDVLTEPRNPIVGPRAFSDRASVVAEFGARFVRGLAAAGVVAVPKHFPGHGDTDVDSHESLPVVRRRRPWLERHALSPFRAAFQAGAPAVMVAHVLYPALDAARPASLSPRVLGELLRGELDFSGVVFTDSLAMRAVWDAWGPASAVEALRAGADVVLACGGERAQWEMLCRSWDASRAGDLKPSALARSLARVLALKDALSRTSRPPWQAHAGLATQVAEAAVAILRDRAGRLPLRPGHTAVIHLGWELNPYGERASLARALEACWGPVEECPSASLPDLNWEQVVVASLAWKGGHSQVLRDLAHRFGPRLVVVGLGSPYELAGLPHVDTYVATSSPDPYSVRAAARVLAGHQRARGRPRVRLPQAGART